MRQPRIVQAICCSSLAIILGVSTVTLTDMTSSAMDAPHWSKPISLGQNRPPGLAQISCASPKFCLAAAFDGNTYEYDGERWSPPRQVMPPSAHLDGASCPSQSTCIVVSSTGYESTLHQGVWSKPLRVLPPSGNAVSCAGAFCLVLGEDGRSSVLKDNTWTDVASALLTRPILPSVSCTSSRRCVATDGEYKVAIYANGSWRGVHKIMSPERGPGINSVSCGSSTFCMVVDGLAGETQYRDDQWSRRHIVGAEQGAPGGGGFISVSCTTREFCMATGAEGKAYVYTKDRWTAAPRIARQVFVFDASCVTSTFCMAMDGASAQVTIYR